MPKSNYRKRSKKMRGGFLGFGEGESSVGSMFSGLTSKAKNATGSVSSLFSSSPPAEAPAQASAQPAYQAPAQPAYSGGKRRRRSMRGGYHSSTGNSSLANNASTYSSRGGTKKRRHKHRKSCKHRR
jgi:hypothetical protein